MCFVFHSFSSRDLNLDFDSLLDFILRKCRKLFLSACMGFWGFGV